MRQLKRLRTIIFVAGPLYLIVTPLLLTFWDRNWATSIFVYGGIVALVICSAVYIYGFIFWKEK